MLTNLVARMREAIGLRSAAHKAARDYWRRCSWTFLAGDPTYYDRQEAAIRELLLTIDPAPLRALDVGCGNGRFSFVLGERAKQVIAFDLSPTLIEEARELAIKKAVKNVAFHARDLEAGFPEGLFDLVACMGITSTLIDEGAFRALVGQLRRSLKPGGLLIMKDSLSLDADRPIKSGPYITIYRSADRYERQFADAGFGLQQVRVLAEADGLINRLYLFDR